MSFPISLATPVSYPGPPPARADVAVIGGGVIGVSTALYLARAGHRVVLLEKGRIAGEQSARNWGWVRVQGRDMAEVPLAQEAQTLWQGFDAECRGRIGLRQTGVTYLTRSEQSLSNYALWSADARALHGHRSTLLSRDELRALLPEARANWTGALHTPGDMVAEPWAAVPELARLASEAGATLVEHCAVRALDIAAGRIAGVVTEAGRLHAPEVVLAGGAWSRLFLARHGLDLPQLSVRASVCETGPLPQVAGTAAVDAHLAFRPRTDGGYSLAPSMASELFLGPDALRLLPRWWPLLKAGGLDLSLRPAAPRDWPDGWRTARRWDEDVETPFERMRILDPAPNRRKIAATCRRFAETFPGAGVVSARTAWAGMIDVLPDIVPCIDRLPGPGGLTVATGLSGHGFGIGPAVGKAVAALVTGERPAHDLTRFRWSRFSDGQPLEPGPNL
ncbi:NAD(P)/FAD-dependent oxidoreductase [Litorisediminicola beolgyonensis]|uniref:NAD(P)/FAD-dependent oxidoreductase n=1 Tax=Litorisediminicola beolgyonensis TaxID=1173614 RepID=A0ABW3ZE15_9RHOB